MWTVPEDTLPTNIYTSSYLSHCTVQYKGQSVELRSSLNPTTSRVVVQMQATSRVAH